MAWIQKEHKKIIQLFFLKYFFVFLNYHKLFNRIMKNKIREIKRIYNNIIQYTDMILPYPGICIANKSNLLI